MRPIDFDFELNPVAALAAATLSGTTAANGENIDLQAYGGGGVIAVGVGSASGSPTSYTVTFKMQTAPDNGSGAPGTYADATDPAGVALSAVISADKGVAQLRVDPTYQNRWVRVVATPAFTGGTSPSVPAFAVAELAAAPLK